MIFLLNQLWRRGLFFGGWASYNHFNKLINCQISHEFKFILIFYEEYSPNIARRNWVITKHCYF